MNKEASSNIPNKDGRGSFGETHQYHRIGLLGFQKAHSKPKVEAIAKRGNRW